MRKKLALAAAGAALVASFGPVGSASAVCITWYYELTGQCSPCHAVGHAVHEVNDVLDELDTEVGLGDVHCLQ